MRAYRRLQGLIGWLLVAYAAGAAVVKLSVRRDREIFPLFAWSLFSTVESEPTEYEIRLLSVGGEASPDGRPMEDAFGLFDPVRSRAEAWTVTQKLGDALRQADARDVARWRLVLESNFLSGRGPVRYEVVRCRYRTLERAASGAVRSVQSIATFTAPG